MEEERKGSRERSAPYSTDYGTNPINFEEESSHDHRSKRRKHGPIIEGDRISTLPESILLRILSSLLTKDAIKTGVLSKRWAYLWTSVPSLHFTDTSFNRAAVLATAPWMRPCLHRAPKLTNFTDSCSLKCHEPIELEIVAPKIESLEILGDFYGMNKCQIKDGSALVEVKLDLEISIDYENDEEEVCKDSVEVVSELFENLHQVKKLIVCKWCLKILLTSNDEVNHWKSKEVYFKSLLRYLKTVKIFGFRKSFHTKEVFILVVEFLL